MLIDTFDGAKPLFSNRGKKRRSVSTLSPSAVLRALSLSKGILRALAGEVEWVDLITQTLPASFYLSNRYVQIYCD